MLDLDDARWIQPWRYYDSSLDDAARIIAIVRSEMTDREIIHQLRIRQMIQLADLLHSFCYNVRKSIEWADAQKVGLIAKARQSLVDYMNEGSLVIDDVYDERIDLVQESFWWIIGRIIHSRETQTRETSKVIVEPYPENAPRTSSKLGPPVVFGFRSDRDPKDEMHWINVEHLIEIYLAQYASEIREAIENHRNALHNPELKKPDNELL